MLGAEIKKCIDAAGLKYTTVSQRIGLSPSAFSAMINGRRKITAEEYFKLCEVLDVPLEHFAQKINPPA